MDIYRIDYYLPKGGEPQKVRQKNDFSHVLKTKAATESAHPPITGEAEETLVSLGKISRKRSTVSSLLIHHPSYKKDCWRIIHSEINHSKPFTKIRPGAEIFLNTKTGEISWGKMLKASKTSLASEAVKPQEAEEKAAKNAEGTNTISERLVGAIEPFMGKAYKEMNCYELLVNGLTNLGYRYRGAGGLSRKLIAMAREHGLPMNAYFNGEGIIEASGTPVYAKSLLKVRSPEEEADKVLKEMEPHLEKGQILAFSIHTKGHTGIISRTDDSWTYINSGILDNALESTKQSEGVGEESLRAELRHWFNLAKTRGESLRITLGRLNEQKLVAYAQPPSIHEKA